MCRTDLPSRSMNNTEKRDKRVPILLTASEFAALSHGAARAGLPLSGYIRTKALDAKRAEDRDESVAYPQLRTGGFT